MPMQPSDYITHLNSNGTEIKIPTREYLYRIHQEDIQAAKSLTTGQQKINSVAQDMLKAYEFAGEYEDPLRIAIAERENSWDYLDYANS